MLQRRVTTDSFPVWAERDGRRGSQSEEAAPQEHAGVKPTSHDTKALCKMILTQCHRHGAVGTARQIQASQSRVRHFTPTYLGTVELHHHDSQRFKSTHIMYYPYRFILQLMKNAVQLFVTAGIFNFNSESSHLGCKCPRTQKRTLRHSHKSAVGLHTVCTCYLSRPHSPSSLCFSAFLSFRF